MALAFGALATAEVGRGMGGGAGPRRAAGAPVMGLSGGRPPLCRRVFLLSPLLSILSRRAAGARAEDVLNELVSSQKCLSR